MIRNKGHINIQTQDGVNILVIYMTLFALIILPLVSKAEYKSNARLCKNYNPSLTNNWEELFLRVENKSIQTVEEFICATPKSNISTPLLIIRSRSLQNSFLGGPRIIVNNEVLSDENADTTLYSFNHPAMTAGNKIEVFKYNINKPTYFVQMFELDLKMGHVEKNPRACQKCHGIENRPIWNQIGFWPSAVNGGTEIRNKEEFASLKLFMENAPSRYSFIKDGVVDFNSLNGDLAAINDKLGKLNSKRIYKKMRDIPEYSALKYSILASILECPDIQTFIPESLKINFKSDTDIDEKVALNLIRTGLENLAAFLSNIGRDSTNNF